MKTDSPLHVARTRGADCDNCPLDGQKRGPVITELKPADILIVLDHPTTNDIRLGRPVTGQIEQLLNTWLKRAGNPSYVITHSLLCSPPEGLQLQKLLGKNKDNKPTQRCSSRLSYEIERVQPKCILTMGKFALESTAKSYGLGVGKGRDPTQLYIHKLGTQRGHPFRVNDVWILPTFSPQMALSQRHWLQVVRDDVMRASSLASSGTSWEDPYYEVLSDLSSLEALVWRSEEPLMVDIETNGIKSESRVRCIGSTQEGQNIIVPLYTLWGHPYWNPGEMLRVHEILKSWFDNYDIQGQNFQFDSRVLADKGLWDRGKYWEDLRTHYFATRESDCPANLNHISSRFCEAPVWKSEADHKTTEEDYLKMTQERREALEASFHHYTACDIVTQRLSMRGVKEWCDTDSHPMQLEVDRKLAPIIRDMGDQLGLFVDIATRDKLRAKCDEVIAEKLQVLRDITNDKFNPNSPAQVTDWIYKKWYCPQFTATGEPATDADDASTGEKALLKLREHGVQPHVAAFIDALLFMRGYSKLRGTYLSDKNTEPSEWDHLLRLRPTYLCPGTVTGRLAANPNVLALPSRGLLNIKSMFVPPPGHAVVKADFNQLEARVMAAEAGDDIVLEALEKGKDVHALTAAKLFAPIYNGYTEDSLYEAIANRKSLSPDQAAKFNFIRQIAKTLRFASAYGAGASKLFLTMSTARDPHTYQLEFPGLKSEEVHKWFKLWQRINPQIKRFARESNDMCKALGYVEESIHHRRRHFPDGPSSPTEPPNFRIQAAASALTNTSMLGLYEELPYHSVTRWSGIALQCHDELVLYVPKDNTEHWARRLEHYMTHEHKGVPIDAEAEIKYEVLG